MSVIELKTRTNEVSESIIETIENALKMAREGKIKSIAVAIVHADESVGCTWSESDNFAILLGSIARMQHKMNMSQDALL